MAVKAKTALEEALTLSRDAKHDTASADALAESVKATKKKLDSLFGIERSAQKQLEGELKKLEYRHKVANKRSKYGKKYPPFSMEPLTWRHEDSKLPKLVLFSLDSPLFLIKASPSSGWDRETQTTIEPKLPKGLDHIYNDVKNLLRAKVKESVVRNFGWDGQRPRTATEWNVSARFDGVIPDQTRAKIVEAMKVFEQIFIVAEPVLKLESRQVPVPLPADPIVVGWDGEQLWYVDDFDITPIEEAGLLVGPNNT
jgi:hypothetical protein